MQAMLAMMAVVAMTSGAFAVNVCKLDCEHAGPSLVDGECKSNHGNWSGVQCTVNDTVVIG